MPENSVLSRMKRKMSESGIGSGTWMVVISLLLIFFLAVFLRTYFGFGEATAYGTPYLVSGGSDSYYHERAINTAAYEHHSLLKDPMLKYPVGSRNPRPPAYDWSVVLIGYILAPFLGGNLASALSYSLIFSSVIWGSLTIFPVYLIGKRVFNRRTGLIAAFLMAIMPAHMQRSQITYADHDPFVLFFVVLSIYFLLVALEKLKEEEWVKNWKELSSVKSGLSELFKKNKEAFLYSGLSAASATTVALTWKGFSYLYLIIAVYFFLQLFINRFRNVDTTALTFVSAISLGLPLLIAAPYYFLSNQVSWLIAPVTMALGIILLGIFLSLTIRYPWTLVIPALIIALIGAGVILYLFSPHIIETVGRQTGYFTRSKVYKTIAEAQAPMISNMILSFGPVTFFLSLLGILWVIWKIRKNWNPFFVFFVIWSAESMYMAISAARFMFNAAPAFALASAFILVYIIKETNFSQIKKTYRSLSGNKTYAIKKSVKLSHVIVALFLVFMVVMPNVWYAIDGGIPYTDKKEYDLQVYDAMPQFMRPDSSLYNASNSRSLWYFGAFGYQLPTPNQYWPAAWSWFRQQDNNVLPEERPGFLSWWDYGFEAIQQGEHPAVADNFQNGYQIAGSLIMAQNETESVSLLSERILDSEFDSKSGQFSQRALQVMQKYLTPDDIAEITDIYNHPQDYVAKIMAHPEIYGPYDSLMNDLNARYVAARGVLQRYDEEQIVNMLKSLEDVTGKRISYFAIDSRLIPFSAQNTGIFYAPAVLSDRRITEGNYRIPYDFYMIYAISNYGKRYPINEVPDDEKKNINHTEIQYNDMFYNSMLYRNYFGYSPKEAGIGDNGLPGLSENMKKNMPMPAWNLTHFRLVYRTAYWNPHKDYQNYSDAWQAVSMEQARKHQQAGDGVVDMSPSTLYNGVTFIEYYEGAVVNGTVTTPGGSPIGNVRVTVYDEYGIPHQTTKTDNNGHYSVLAPFGNVTILVSNGGSMDKIRLSEKNLLNATHFSVQKYQAFRDKYDMDGDGKWDYYMEENPVVSTSTVDGRVFIDTNNDKVAGNEDPGVPANITIYGKNIEINYTVQANSSGEYVINDVVPGDYGLFYDFNGFRRDINTTISVQPSKKSTQDVPIPTGSVKGIAVYPNGNYASNLKIRMYAVDSHNKFNFTTDNNGAYYIAGVMPGVYQIDAVSGNITTSNSRFAIMDNYTSYSNFTVYPAATISGYVTLNGKALPYAGLNFINYTKDDVRRSVTTDKNGYFSVKIAKGRYTAYSSYVLQGSKYTVAENIYITSDSSVSFDMKRSYEVSGYVKYKDYYKDRFPVTFINDDGARMDFYSMNGNYTAFVPEGRYHVYVSHAFATFPYAYSAQMSISSNKHLDIDLVKGARIEGNIRGVEDMPVPFARLVFRSGTASFETFTDASGTFEYYLVPGNYTLDMSAPGYDHKTMEISPVEGDNPQLNLTLSAMQNTVKGTVSLNGQPASGINISFYGYNNTYNTTTDDSGNYSIDLYGGTYVIKVSQDINGSKDERYELVSSQYIYVNPYANDITRNLSIEKRYRVSGEVLMNGHLTDETRLYFSRGSVEMPYTTTNGSFEVYLPEGKYVLNSTYPGLYTIYTGIDVNSSIEGLNLSYERGYSLTVKMMSEGKEITGIPLNITVSGGASKTYISNNTISAELVNGTYMLSVNYTHIETVESIARNVSYSAEMSVDVSGDRSVILDVNRYVPEGSLDASLEIGESKIGDGEVFLRSQDSGKEYVFPVHNGSFSADVPMGVYTIYSTSSAGDNPYAVMDNIAIGENTVKDIKMESAAVFSGKSVNDNGDPLISNVTVISLHNQDIQRHFSTDDNGTFSIILPRGEYSLLFNSVREEYGISTTYMKNFDINLTFSRDSDVVMDRIDVYRADLSWDSSEKVTVAPGEDVTTYKITVKNAGNTKDRFTFESDPWACDFQPSSIELAPNESAPVTVVIHVAKDAEVGHEPLRVNAISENKGSSVGTVILDIGIKETVGGEFGDISEANWDSGNAVYAVEVKNTGNAPNTFIITPANVDILNSKGWDISLAGDKDGPYSESTSVSIGPNSTQSIYVKMSPKAESPAYDVDFSLSMTSENGVQAESSIPAELPSVEIKGDLTFGDSSAQVWNPQPMDMTPIYWAIGIVIFLAAVYIVLKKKGVIL